MRGERVVVKSVTGPLVRRIWEVYDDAVIVVPDDLYAKLQAGEEDAPLSGFPPEDVFEMITSEVPDNPDWTHMQQWRPE